MRKTLLTILFLLVLVPACLADDAAPEFSAEDLLAADPVGAISTVDGRRMDILKFEKFKNYFCYLSGKVNGRSSTLISFTREDDMRRWKQIEFKDPYNFTLFTKSGKKFEFTDGYFYLGSTSSSEYAYIGVNPDTYDVDHLTIKKADVKAIEFK